ncbi:hypothetical protein [Pedobacter sp.]|uniref:hypothetical protein n=1 Tax=Pedobacter sp. TaxID=1411316 RepID=UPI003D7FB8DA
MTLFKKGKLVFTDSLQQKKDPETNVPYFTARALVIAEDDDHTTGSIETLKITDLISKMSHFVYDGVNSREAHKLYTWPVNLGDSNAWAESKRSFLEQHVMHFPIRLHKVENEDELTWEFISPEEFKKSPPDLQASADFQHYLDHQAEYFFLRKERNDPK